jgi:hypothetical protein
VAALGFVKEAVLDGKINLGFPGCNGVDAEILRLEGVLPGVVEGLASLDEGDAGVTTKPGN